MKKPIRIDLDGPYYPKPSCYQRVWNGLVLAVLLTGRGALRQSFEARLAKRSLKAIAVRTAWLEPGDYPTLIGMADLGLCLHQSSSGLDLPMKLADLRGAGVPVLAARVAHGVPRERRSVRAG